jgi:hypothetical protein
MTLDKASDGSQSSSFSLIANFMPGYGRAEESKQSRAFFIQTGIGGSGSPGKSGPQQTGDRK